MRAAAIAVSSLLLLGGCAASRPVQSTLVIPGSFAIVVESHTDPMLLRSARVGQTMAVVRQLSLFMPEARVMAHLPEPDVERQYDIVIVLRDSVESQPAPVLYEIRRHGRVAAHGMIHAIQNGAPPASLWSRDSLGGLLQELETVLLESGKAETV